MQELQEAIEEVNDFNLEKHGKVYAAAIQAMEDNRVGIHKAKQDLRKDSTLAPVLRQLTAEGERTRGRFFDLFRQRYLAVRLEKERVRKGKGHTRFPAEDYCPFEEEDGRAGPSSESGRGSERSGLVYSMPINHPAEPLARGPHSDPSAASNTSPPLRWTPDSSSSDDANPDPAATICNPATKPIAKKTPPRLNPLATPFPDPSLGIQTTKPPNRHLHLAHPPDPIPPPRPSVVPVPGRHGPLDNTAPLLPPAVYIAGAQLQQRLRGVSVGPVRAVPSQMVFDQQRQTQHQTIREYEIQLAKGRIWWQGGVAC